MPASMHRVRLVVATAGGSERVLPACADREPGCVIEVLRGRITPDSARLEIELSGTRRQVDEALRVLRESGVVVSQVRGSGGGEGRCGRPRPARLAPLPCRLAGRPR